MGVTNTISSGNTGLPLGWLSQAYQDLDRGGLASTIGPDETKNLPPFHGQGNIIDRSKFAVSLG
jgi:hypothetical protein